MKGKRVRLIKMDDKWTSLTSGDEGIIQFVDGIGQIHVNWDNGSKLALIPGVDEYEILDGINEKSTSKSQQRLMGWALACKKGIQKDCPDNIEKLGKSMSEEDLEDFAKTKHAGLPEKIEKVKKNECIMNFSTFVSKSF